MRGGYCLRNAFTTYLLLNKLRATGCGPSSQGCGFSLVMYGCESWTIKKTEHRRIDAFELWVLENILESPLNFKEIQPVHPEGDQSWVFSGRTDVEADTPKLGHLMGRADSFLKILMLGKIEGGRRRGRQRIRRLHSITNSMDMNYSKLWEIVEDRVAWCATVHGVTKSQTRQQLNNISFSLDAFKISFEFGCQHVLL